MSSPRTVCFLVAALVVLSSGCSPLPRPTATPTIRPTTALPTPSPEPTIDPRLGGRLAVRLPRDLDRLTLLDPAPDPEARWLLGMLYAGLVRLDDHLLPRPDLAEGWTVSPDGLLVTFTLRPDLRWSDGTPLTADDVRFTCDVLRAGEARTGLQADLRDYVVAVTTPTTRTVAFLLNLRLANLLTDAAFPVLPRHIWGHLSPGAVQEADLLANPVGSGPFALRERRPGQALVLLPNPHFHGLPPFLDEVAFLVAPDPLVAEVALRQGDLHVAMLSRASYRSLLDDPPRTPLRLARFAAPQYTFVAFNLREGHPLADPLVRQAWAAALDKAAIVASATAGEGLPLWSPILPPSWAYDAELEHPEADLPRARQLLAEAGWQDGNGDGVLEKDGRPLRVRLFVRADAAERITASLQMSETLGQIGMAVEVIPADFQSVITAKLRPPYDFDALCMQWRNLGADPDQFYLWHSSQVWQGPEDTRQNLYNFVGYRSAEADALLLAGRDTYDLEKRRQVYVDLQRLLAQDLPYYFLWGDPRYLAGAAKLTTPEGPVNWETPNPFWNVERWYWER